LQRTIISSEKIHSGPVFEVVRDRIREDSGSEYSREVVMHNGGAGGVAMLDDGRIALVRQYRHPAKKELLEIPAGKIDGGEAPEICAAREIEEELGMRPGKMLKLTEFYSTPGFCAEKLFLYLATELQPTKQNLDHDEQVEIVYTTLDEAMTMISSGEIEDAKTIIALLLVKQIYG
jgi:ADP-ribose pyrophosphatase